jgi:hypothetical protein
VRLKNMYTKTSERSAWSRTNSSNGCGTIDKRAFSTLGEGRHNTLCIHSRCSGREDACDGNLHVQKKRGIVAGEGSIAVD